MRITWLTHSLELEQDSIVYIQQSKTPFQIKFKIVQSSLIVNKNQLSNWNPQSLEKIYQGSQCSFDELKNYLKNSPFASILRTKFSKISKQDQLRVIRDLAILNQVDFVHFKEPSLFFIDNDIDQFAFGLDRPCIIESIQPCRYKSSSWRLDSKGATNLQQCLPESIEDLAFFDSKQRFQATLIKEKEETFMVIGNIEFQMDSEQVSQLMGLFNQDLVIAMNAQDFEISKKQKNGFLKIDIIKQSFRCGHWLQSFAIQNQVLTRTATARSRTPFLFIRPNLRSCWIFSAESRKILFPAGPNE
tara:strand:- start:491 stop:1396 length:906 start_codon:yes stop_codon:yes gene_type:complete